MEYVAGVPFDRYWFRPSLRRCLVRRTDPARAETSQFVLGVESRSLVAIGPATVRRRSCRARRRLHPPRPQTDQRARDRRRPGGDSRFRAGQAGGSKTISGEGLSGTPAYMAPEQALEKPCLPAADWYAVGTMIYEVLTGRCPFEGTLFEVLLRKQTEESTTACPSQSTGGRIA